jgi:hypothetical protein
MSYWLTALALILLVLVASAIVMTIPLIWNWLRRMFARPVNGEESSPNL